MREHEEDESRELVSVSDKSLITHSKGLVSRGLKALQESEDERMQLEMDILLEQGFECLELRDHNGAIKWSNKAIELDPQDPAGFHLRGFSYLEKGECDQAIGDFNKAIELNPQYAPAYHGRMQVYSRLYQVPGNADKAEKDYISAILWYTAAIGFNLKDATIYMGRAAVYLAWSHGREAITDYNVAIDLRSQDPTAYNNRGCAYYEGMDYTRAIQDYGTAIELNPQRFLFYKNRALARQDNSDKAIKDIDKAIELNPQDSELYNLSGRKYKQRGDRYDSPPATGNYTQAIRGYAKAIELDPQDFRSYKDRAAVYEKLGQTPNAEADLEKAELLRLQEHAVRPRYGLPRVALTYVRARTFSRCREIFEEEARNQIVLRRKFNRFIITVNGLIIVFHCEESMPTRNVN